MTTVSIGDLAQSLLLRRATGQARNDLAGLTADLTAGQASDPGRHMRGLVSPLLALDAGIADASVHQKTSAQAAARGDAMQSVLSRIDSVAESAGQALLAAAASQDPAGLRNAGRHAINALETTVNSLNTRFAGEALFAGVRTDSVPLAPADTILGAARDMLATARTPAEAATLLRDWMASPTGFEAAAYRGSEDARTIPVGPDDSVRFDFLAKDRELQGTFAGLILGALVAEGRFTPVDGAQAGLARIAGETLLSQGAERAGHAARLGVLQSRIDNASDRASVETNMLRMARNDLLSVDLYEASTRLKETETRLEMIYTLTARLSRLSLTDYM